MKQEYTFIAKSWIVGQYITYGVFTPEEVLPFIGYDKRDRKEYKILDTVFIVKMYSARYHVFAKSLSCVGCGIVGTKFLLQRDRWNLDAPAKSAHFNLYAEKDGELILMTKDHIIPKSKGGKDHIDNYQTMCKPCNNNLKRDKLDFNIAEIENKS